MPTVTISFSLPEEQEDLDDAMNGREYSLALEGLRQAFRGRAKHHEPETTWHEVYELFTSTLNDFDVSL